MSKFSSEETPAHQLAALQQPTEANKALFAAAERGDGPGAAAALERKAFANWFEDVESGGMTAVHVAARAPSSGALEALIAYAPTGADAQLKPRFDLQSTTLKSTALHEAAAADRAAHVALLLAVDGVRVDGVNAYGDTALAVAAAANSSACAKVLLDAAADARAKNRRGQSPLHLAVAGVSAALRRGKDGDSTLDVVRLLLAEKADPNAEDDAGQTPLHLVAQMRENDTVVKLAKVLLSKGGMSKIRDHNGQRPSEVGEARAATPRGELKALLKSHERLVVDRAA